MKRNHIVSTIAFALVVCSLTLILFMNNSLNKVSSKLDSINNKLITLTTVEVTTEENSEDLNKMPAPEFSLLNAKGKRIGLNAFSTIKKKILVFTAKDCHYCEDYYPELNKFTKEYKDVEVIVITEGTTTKDLQKLYTTKSYNFTQLVGDLDVFEKYQVSSTPTTFLLDETNNVLRIGVVNTKEDLETFVFHVS